MRFEDDDELVAMVGPFIDDGLALGEPTILVVSSPGVARLLAAPAGREGLIVLPPSEALCRPAVRLQTLRRVIDVHLASGAERVRVVSSLPVDDHEEPPIAWQPWARLEAYLDLAFAGLPVWQRCLYDVRTTDADALAQALRTHDHEVPALDLLASLLFLDEALDGPGRPVIELHDPTPAAARRAVGELATGVALDPDDRDGLVAAASEIVTNAQVHGRGPVVLCAWHDDSQVVVAVTDHGEGPRDPTVGLAPARRAPGDGGFGLWIASQSCRLVTLHRGVGSFTVRMVAQARSHG